MTASAPHSRRKRRILYALLIVSALLLGVVIAMVLPIVTHQSAGGSGQAIPEGFVSTTNAEGADGRTRVLSVETESGEPADLAQLEPGQVLVVQGTGYDPGIGVYVSICMIPTVPGEKPSPCLGGLPEGAMEGEAAGSDEAASSAWITSDWAWRAFATKGYDDPDEGSFEVRLLVPPASQDGLNCEKAVCAVTTRADHTASSDRVQDMMLPVAFVAE